MEISPDYLKELLLNLENQNKELNEANIIKDKLENDYKVQKTNIQRIENNIDLIKQKIMAEKKFIDASR